MSPGHINFGAMGTAQMVLGAAMSALGFIGFLRVFSAGRCEAWGTVLFGMGNVLAGYGLRTRQSWEGPPPAIQWLGLACMAAPLMFRTLRWLYRRRLGGTVSHLRDGNRRE